MVMTESNSNAILIESMKNRTTGKMIQAYQTLIDRLRAAGIVLKLYILDNKCSQDFKDTIHQNKNDAPTCYLHDHQQNLAEKVIQTFKDHFIAILLGGPVEKM